jgi:hypothetical protein
MAAAWTINGIVGDGLAAIFTFDILHKFVRIIDRS